MRRRAHLSGTLDPWTALRPERSLCLGQHIFKNCGVSKGSKGLPHPASRRRQFTTMSSKLFNLKAMAFKAELEQAISVLYSLDRSAEDRSRASQWLESFQQSSMAWQVKCFWAVSTKSGKKSSKVEVLEC